MSKILLSFLVFILCIVSFVAGTAFNTINIANDAFQSLDELTKMAIDPKLQIRRDIDLYEDSLTDPSKVSKSLRFFILTNYDWSNRCIGEYCDQMNMNSPSYETNKLILEYLNKYSVKECKHLNHKARVECNLDLI